MAEEVQISNVGGDGVASEITLQRLVATMESMAAGKGKSGAAAKVQDLHNRSVAAGTTATATNTTATAKATATTTTAGVATGKFAKTIATATSSVLGKFAGSVAGLTRELLGGAEDISSFARHLPFVGGYLSSLTGLIDENIDSFRKMSQVGATFGDGLNDIRATAARAGIPLGEFTDLVAQNAGRMQFFGATTAAGATAFANMSKQLREGPGKRFLALGYTAQELNEALIDYAEFTQSQVGAERTQNKMTAEGAANYLETIDQLAAVTGKRRDQIKAEMNAGLADQRARLAMANMSTEEQKRFSANLAAAPKGLQDALTDAADGVLDNPLTQGLSVASETFRKDADKIKNMNAQEYNNFMAKVGKELDASGKALGAGAQAVMSSNTGYGQAIAMGAELRDKQHMSDKDYADLLEKRNKEAAADDSLKGFSDAIRNLRAGLMTTFIDSGVLRTLQDAFNSLAKVVSTPEFKEGLKVVVNGLISGLKLLIGTVTTVVEFLGSIGKTFGTAGVIAAVVAGITALFAAKVVVGALASKVSGSIKEKALSATGLGSPKTTVATPAKNAADAGKGVGSAIGNIGGGIGKGLGGILSGLASGISAFANPMVVAGAAALGAAIVLIGGAIAGATWLVGKSLPTMAEGLKSFEALDGQKLIDTGKGMGAIALGMAAFGAGSAVAGLGSLVGGISEGLVSLFGGDNPLTKLEEFQKYNLDAARIENNANALVSYSKGMAALGGSSAMSGIGSVVGAIGSGITALFGADDPLTGLLKFQAYNLDTAKITNNGLAIKAYATAMQNFPASPSVSILSAAKDAIISLLGGGTNTMSSIKSFGDMAFNVSGIIGNAKALKAYADAMKDFPASPSVSLFDSFKNGIISFLGGNTNPFTPMMKFGEMKFNTAGIVRNSEAVKSFSTSMSGLASLSTTGDIKIPTLSGLSSLTAIGDIKMPTNLASNLDILNKGLDTTGLRTYTKAMEDLVSVLGDLNTELGKDKTAGTEKTSAGSVVAKTNPQAVGGGSDDQLNSIMNEVLLVLNDMRDLDDKVEKNTRNIIGSNLAQGGVSKIGR